MQQHKFHRPSSDWPMWSVQTMPNELAFSFIGAKALPKGGVMSKIGYNNPEFKAALAAMFAVKEDEEIVAIKFDEEGISVYFEKRK